MTSQFMRRSLSRRTGQRSDSQAPHRLADTVTLSWQRDPMSRLCVNACSYKRPRTERNQGYTVYTNNYGAVNGPIALHIGRQSKFVMWLASSRSSALAVPPVSADIRLKLVSELASPYKSLFM